MKTKEEIISALQNSRKYNIWANTKVNPGSGCCEYCGRKTGKAPLYVHVTYMGTCIPNDITEDEVNQVEESQGSFAIGSECAKKLFGSEIAKYTSN